MTLCSELLPAVIIGGKMKIKKIIVFALALCLALALASCVKDTRCTVTFDSNGGKPVVSQKVQPGGYAVNPGTPDGNDGYMFRGWYLDDKLWDFDSDKVETDIVLKAKWEAMYTVSFNSDGGTKYPAKSVMHNSLVANPGTPVKDGYVFIGWFHGNTKWDFSSNIVSSNITLVAKWAAECTATFDPDNGNDPQSFIFGAGYTISAPVAPTKEHFEFAGWYTNGVLWDFNTDIITEDTQFIAKWTHAETYVVTFDTNGGTEISPQYVPYGEKISNPGTVEKEGFKFDGWYLGDKYWDMNLERVYSNITLVARWIDEGTIVLPPDRFAYTIKFDTVGGSTLKGMTCAARKTLAEVNKTLPTPTKEGYRFIGWYTDDTYETLFDENTVVSKDLVLVARWGHMVTFDTGIEGSTPEMRYCAADGKIAEPQEPFQYGKIFVGWYYNGTAWDFENGIVMSDMTLVAKWADLSE